MLGAPRAWGAAVITLLSIVTFVRALATRAQDASHPTRLSHPLSLR